MAEKIKATSITLDRAEGLHEEVGPVVVVGTRRSGSVWKRANRILSCWATTAPKGGGYDKVDFKVEYVDGESYEGRYDMHHQEDADLAGHIGGFMQFEAGRLKPPHLTQKQYDEYLRNQGGESRAAVEFLEKYEIGDEPEEGESE